MNPQTPEQDQNQQFTVNDTTQLTPEPTAPVVEPTSEADAVALHEIDALEAESPTTAVPEAPVSVPPSQPAMSSVSPNPESAPTVVSSDAPVSPVTAPQAVETPSVEPAQPAISPTPQVTSTFPSQPAPAKKKSLLIAIIVVAVVVVGVAAGYFVWQAMGK